MPAHWYNSEVIDIQDLTSSTRQFTVKIDEVSNFDFLPGQFVIMDLPVGEKRLHRWRSYSIANAPGGTNILEFCIVKSVDGIGTKYLFEETEIGTQLKFKGPEGGFTLPKDLTKEIIMICTGTGVAPFRSMLHHIFNHNMAFHKIHLIFGTRTDDNILYKDEFEKMTSSNSNFKYDIALSRQNIIGYNHGYVHDVYLDLYQEVDVNRHFYICGWSQMIDDAVANLMIKIGYDKSQIHYELYG